MKSSNEIRKEIAAQKARVEAMISIAKEEARDFTKEESDTVDGIVGTDSKEGILASLEKDLERALRVENAIKSKVREIEANEEQQQRKLPAVPKSHGKLKGFKDPADAYASGQFVLANLFGNKKAKAWCRDNGVKATMTTGNNPSAGFLVPDSFEAAIIELREMYGVWRNNSTVWPMGPGKTIVPRLSGEVSTYYVGEESTITASDMTVNQVELDAKKLAAMVTVSSDLNEDSVIDIADLIARSVAQQFAIAEDQAGFLGDGTSTYGGIVGLAAALQAGSLYTATSRQTFGVLTFADFESVIGQCKLWRGSSPKWYISQAGWAASMQRLANAAGGVTMAELANGMAASFMGYPVVVSQVLTSALTGTTTQRACYFGDLALGSYLGSRRGISIALDSSRYFEQDLIAIKATQRFDINVHDRGTASVSGGIVGMVFG
jgi:HK97 family phage major capsid protein